jgi:hypothetical protein
MNQQTNEYRVDYTIKGGVGLQRQEVISARSDFEARKIIESRYEPGRVYIICVTKIS